MIANSNAGIGSILLSLGAVTCILQACTWGPDPVPWVGMAQRYRENAVGLTDWTIEQDNCAYLVRGMFALELIANGSTKSVPSERAKALVGLVRLAEKRATGWPENCSPSFAVPSFIIGTATEAMNSNASTRQALIELGEAPLDAPQREAWRRAVSALHVDGSPAGE